MELLQLNIVEIIKTRLGNRAKWLPRFVLRPLERLICQSRLNELLRVAYPAEGSEFSDRILRELGISLDVTGLDSLPDDEKFIFASNHPLGGLDGIALVKILGQHYGDENIGVLVNDMLMHVAPLSKVFLPVNKYGAQGRQAARLLHDALASGRQMVMFPAGLVSRLGDDGAIADLEWQKSFVQKALESGRRIVPVRFEGLNRRRFYRLARLRKRLGIGVNLEQALLPSELCASQGASYRVTFLPPVDPSAPESDGLSPRHMAAHIRSLIYSR